MTLKQTVKWAGARVGLDIRRSGFRPDEERSLQRGALRQLARMGVTPATVVDVGAAHGTPALYETFPAARHLLVEPLAEFEAPLRALAAGLSDARVVMAAAGPCPGRIVLNVHPDLVGSSAYREDEDSDVNGTAREVPQVTVDELVASSRSAGPYLLKVDAQGYELDVLRGAVQVLPATEAVLLEVSLFRFFQGGPDFAEVVAFMRDLGLVAYDVLDLKYRPLDGAQSQVDIVFVPEASPLRRHHAYATPRQREEWTARVRASMSGRLS